MKPKRMLFVTNSGKTGGISWLCLIPADEMLIQQLSGYGTELMWL